HTVRGWPAKAQVMIEGQQKTWRVIEQIRGLHVQPMRAATVLVLNDPFDGFDTMFIARLFWRDPTIQIFLGNRFDVPITAEKIREFDWVLSFEGSTLRVVRSPQMIR